MYVVIYVVNPNLAFQYLVWRIPFFIGANSSGGRWLQLVALPRDGLALALEAQERPCGRTDAPNGD